MFRLTDSAHLCVEIKKSRFIATCIPIASTDDVPDALQRLRADDATHNCWAWRFGDAYRFCDDGEPGSSAGRPILAAIDGQSFDAVREMSAASSSASAASCALTETPSPNA